VTKLEGARSDQQGATGTYPSLPWVVQPSKQSTVAVVQPASDVKTANQRDANQIGPSSPEEIQRAVSQIESYLKSVGRQLEFRVDDSTGRTVVTVKDLDTGEVIRRIPGDETLRLARSLADKANALVDVEV